MSDTPLIIEDLVSLDKSIGESKEQVIDSLCGLIADSGRAQKDGLVEAVMAREAKSVTGMPGGIAIPHCRTEAVSVGSLAFARLKPAVDFGAKDGPADLVFLIAADENSGQSHLKLLQKLARKLVDKEFLSALRGANDEAEVVHLITQVVQPDAAPSQKSEESHQDQTSTTTADDTPLIVAVTSCPTGIAHTYMAADSLTNTAKEMGVELHVEPQGSGGVDRLSKDIINRAGAVIFANDVSVQMPERFAHLPVVQTSVKKAISDPKELIEAAVKKAKDPNAKKAASVAQTSSDGDDESQLSWPRRIQKAVMAGVSYMIPFVAAGGLLIALGFLIGGYDVAGVAQDVSTKFAPWNLPGVYTPEGASDPVSTSGFALYLGAVLTFLGQQGMGFLVAALSGYIAFGLAGRPGIAPGFIGGAISVILGAGFIGGLITGIVAGLIAYWLASLKPPRWLAGLMPVVIIPLVTTLIMGLLMVMLLGRPLAAIMTGLQNWLGSMSGSSAVVLGIIIGLMMCFDLGGPVNKAAYLFGTAGLSAGSPDNMAPFYIMAAVMVSGMVPPLAMALSTAVRPKLYTPAERENGKAAWLLGLSFISEGAIPFAASDPLRVIPSMMFGGAVAGGISMALSVGLKAPHGGLFVIFAISPWWGFLIALVAGTVVGALVVTILKQVSVNKKTKVA